MNYDWLGPYEVMAYIGFVLFMLLIFGMIFGWL